MTESAPETTGLFAGELDCPECGYSLRGLTQPRCPECGLDLAFVESHESLIPWQRARKLRRLPAFWHTVALVTFRPKRFCRAACQPVSYRAAVGFRFTAITHALLAAIVLVLVTDHYGRGSILPGMIENTAEWFPWVVAAALYIGLIVFTGFPTYLFHPRYLSVRRQNRAVCLAHYGCGPLALALPLALAASGLVAALAGNGASDRTDTLWLAVGMLTAIGTTALLGCWWCWSKLAACLLQSGVRRLVLTWLWWWVSLLVALAACGFVLWAVYFVAIVVYSLSR